MNNDELLKALRVLTGFMVKEAVSREHERIREALNTFATTHGFATPLDELPNGLRPDVIRTKVEGGKTYLFVGDAKVPENETPRRIDTLLRVSRYVDAFARYVGEGRIAGGFLAIATNSKDSAAEWVTPLGQMAEERGLTSGNKAPSFRVEEINANTWVTFW